MAVEIVKAQTTNHFGDASALIREYAGSLGFDLAFQNFDDEMASLPAMYNEADGGLFVAYLDSKPIGVAGLRRFNATDAELKRMFVKVEVRGAGAGRQLLEHCIETARQLNYRALKLDSVATMRAAIKLYLAYGFVEIEPYRFNTQEDARYFELIL